MFRRYLDEALNNVSFDDANPEQQIKLDRLLSYSLASELQCLRSAYGLFSPMTCAVRTAFGPKLVVFRAPFPQI